VVVVKAVFLALMTVTLGLVFRMAQQAALPDMKNRARAVFYLWFAALLYK
jgi:hypothetical protein